ncbi:hypothetical protein SAMN05518801_101345 [Novosphingobium sp. CF614]|uniref:hypothetical protein n=1 Tax=Novosphingobium sp. CF614 TaxID=1884364 RepID=UPI0008E81579|nr:hypothetical protein [Novosphingobium sp. CF614]SFF76461.1 hypothetical protein SAMN05518801_101345 [Novosphingobium sp. CF614]
MPGPVLHVGAVGMCPHAGQMAIAPGNPRVMLGGMPAATMADVATIAGCVFQVPIPGGTKPQPCVTVQWLVPATRVTAGGQPLILSTSPGLCKSAEQIPQGPPTVTTVQMRVIAQ